MVPQLHMHHIARFTNDIAWPKPVWGFASMRAFEPEEYSRRVNAMALEIPKQRHLFA
jgi:diadenosine tetraphosphate (Ap4A) HIT family hydrolase